MQRVGQCSSRVCVTWHRLTFDVEPGHTELHALEKRTWRPEPAEQRGVAARVTNRNRLLAMAGKTFDTETGKVTPLKAVDAGGEGGKKRAPATKRGAAASTSSPTRKKARVQVRMPPPTLIMQLLHCTSSNAFFPWP